jgi:hypothetical protein
MFDKLKFIVMSVPQGLSEVFKPLEESDPKVYRAVIGYVL